MSLRFALNRTCAPQLSLADFIALAQGAGVQAVEIRGDIEGREFADGTTAAEVRARLDDAGLAAASVNALQRFNDWSDERAREAKAMIAYTAALGAPGLVLCPAHTPQNWDAARAGSQLREGLRQLAPILRDHGVTGYVEPLGMRHSTLTRQDMAATAIAEVEGWDCFALCYDTFQFFRCGDDALVPGRIGLAHISGISRPDLAPQDLTEPDRGLVFAGDRVGNIAQLRSLIAAGYSGYISLEPFDPGVQGDPDLPRKLRASLDHVAAGVACIEGDF